MIVLQLLEWCLPGTWVAGGCYGPSAQTGQLSYKATGWFCFISGSAPSVRVSPLHIHSSSRPTAHLPGTSCSRLPRDAASPSFHTVWFLQFPHSSFPSFRSQVHKQPSPSSLLKCTPHRAQIHPSFLIPYIAVNTVFSIFLPSTITLTAQTYIHKNLL